MSHKKRKNNLLEEWEQSKKPRLDAYSLIVTNESYRNDDCNDRTYYLVPESVLKSLTPLIGTLDSENYYRDFEPLSEEAKKKLEEIPFMPTVYKSLEEPQDEPDDDDITIPKLWFECLYVLYKERKIDMLSSGGIIDKPCTLVSVKEYMFY